MPRKTDPLTPLISLLRALTAEQRDDFACKADTPVSYLYALGTCQRTCSVKKARLIERTSREFNALHGTPVVTMEQLATMCPLEN